MCGNCARVSARMTRVRQMGVPIVAVIVFAFTLGMRVWGITRDFWLAGDQIRDAPVANLIAGQPEIPRDAPASHAEREGENDDRHDRYTHLANASHPGRNPSTISTHSRRVSGRFAVVPAPAGVLH